MSERIGRNDSCPCGSGKKYKKCCMLKDQQPRKISAKLIKGSALNLPQMITDAAAQTAEDQETANKKKKEQKDSSKEG